MPGRFLELGLGAADVAASLAFYESLGFVQAPVGEAWPHPYAVVTDGRLHLGLHGIDVEAPLLTFVTPDLRARLDGLAHAGLEVEQARLDDVTLNEARFRDPAGLHVRLLEARTYSPPALDPGFESALGWFESLAVETADPARAGRFWESLGGVAFEEPDGAGSARVTVAHRDLNLDFQDRELHGPMPCFAATGLEARVASLRARGFRFAARAPRGFDGRGAAVLLAPDGLRLLLLEAAG